MSFVLISNNRYIKKWNILEQSIKPSIIHYKNLENIKQLDFKDRRNILGLGLLWDNVGNSCRIPFFDNFSLKDKKERENL